MGQAIHRHLPFLVGSLMERSNHIQIQAQDCLGVNRNHKLLTEIQKLVKLIIYSRMNKLALRKRFKTLDVRGLHV